MKDPSNSCPREKAGGTVGKTNLQGALNNYTSVKGGKWRKAEWTGPNH